MSTTNSTEVPAGVWTEIYEFTTAGVSVGMQNLHPYLKIRARTGAHTAADPVTAPHFKILPLEKTEVIAFAVGDKLFVMADGPPGTAPALLAWSSSV